MGVWWTFSSSTVHGQKNRGGSWTSIWECPTCWHTISTVSYMVLKVNHIKSIADLWHLSLMFYSISYFCINYCCSLCSYTFLFRLRSSFRVAGSNDKHCALTSINQLALHKCKNWFTFYLHLEFVRSQWALQLTGVSKLTCMAGAHKPYHWKCSCHSKWLFVGCRQCPQTLLSNTFRHHVLKASSVDAYT